MGLYLLDALNGWLWNRLKSCLFAAKNYLKYFIVRELSLLAKFEKILLTKHIFKHLVRIHWIFIGNIVNYLSNCLFSCLKAALYKEINFIRIILVLLINLEYFYYH